MRRRRTRALSLVAVLSSLSGCTALAPTCTLEGIHGVQLEVRDSATGAPVRVGLEGALIDGTYIEVIDGMGGFQLAGALERQEPTPSPCAPTTTRPGTSPAFG